VHLSESFDHITVAYNEMQLTILTGDVRNCVDPLRRSTNLIGPRCDTGRVVGRHFVLHDTAMGATCHCSGSYTCLNSYTLK
jgi:hypothetical protein